MPDTYVTDRLRPEYAAIPSSDQAANGGVDRKLRAVFWVGFLSGTANTLVLFGIVWLAVRVLGSTS